MKIISNKWLIPIIMVLILILISVIYAMPTQDLPYEVLKIDKAPAAIYEAYEAQKSHRGYTVNSYDNSNYILITMGEVPTGGYSIDIKDVDKSGDSIVVKAEFNEPDPEEMVIMVISYPAIVVKVPKTDDTIQVWTNEKNLSQLH